MAARRRGVALTPGAGIPVPAVLAAPAVLVALCWTAAVGAYAVLRRGGPSIDEAWSIGIVDRPVSGVLRVIAHRERNMALYFLLLHAWSRVSLDLRWLSLLSVLIGVAAVAAVAWVGHLLSGPVVAAVGALLTAANTTFDSYLVILRGYALDVLLATVAVGCFVRLLVTGRRRWAVAFGVLLLAFTATTVLASLLLAALALAALTRPVGRRPLVLVTLAVTGVLVLGVDLVVLTGDHGNVDWIPAVTLHAVASAAIVLAGGRLGLVAYAVVAVVAVVGVIRRPALLAQDPAARLVVAWVVVPVVGLLGFSLLKHLWVPRYVLFVVPALALGAGLVLRRFRGAVALALVGAALVAAAGLRQPWLAQEDSDPRATAAYVVAHQQPGDAIVYDPAAARAWLGPYLGTWLSTTRGRLRPRDLAMAAHGSPVDRGDTYARDVSPARLAARAASVRRLWVVDYVDWGTERLTPESFDAVERQVLAGRRVAARRRLGDAVVTLYVT